jgi:sialate O-acetylesterase
LPACALLLAVASVAGADVKLPALFSDNMVVQRDMKIPVWGWADPGEQVTVTLGAAKAAATADADGKWTVKLDPLPAGGPLELTVAGKNTLSAKNVLVGEVWICSGQSNMAMGVTGVKNAEQEKAEANYPQLRMFRMAYAPQPEPQADCKGDWSVCAPQTVGGWSAAGYFFARELHQVLGVPVGMINASYNGALAQALTSEAALAGVPELRPQLERKAKLLGDYSKAMADLMRPWLAAYDQAVAAGQAPPPPPPPPPDPRDMKLPTGLYNSMIAPLIPYALRGVIYYQGEHNVWDSAPYPILFKTLIQCWRHNWGEGDFPFLWVQLPNYMPVQAQPTESLWAALRWAQDQALSLPNTGEACTLDLGETANIHPLNKQEVGHRLALIAEKIVYGKDVICYGPRYAGMKVEDDKVRISYTEVDGGLVVQGGAPLKGFAICGEDKQWVWADARVEGDTVVLSSPQVPKPVAVRYAWADNPLCNLYNKAGLPAYQFTTEKAGN